MNPRNIIIALTLGLLGATGCASNFQVKTPDNFVSLQRYRSPTYYKAVSPDNGVITVTAFKHRDRGTLGFWTEIFKREMTLRKGYKLGTMAPVKTQRGLEGRTLAFTATNGGVPYVYVATLFVTAKKIYVIEGAARAKLWPKHKAAMDSLVASFQPG